MEHSFQGKSGVGGGGGVDLDAVDDLALEEVLETTEQVAGVHAVHGGAKALDQRKALDVLVRMALG